MTTWRYYTWAVLSKAQISTAAFPAESAWAHTTANEEKQIRLPDTSAWRWRTDFYQNAINSDTDFHSSFNNLSLTWSSSYMKKVGKEWKLVIWNKLVGLRLRMKWWMERSSSPTDNEHINYYICYICRKEPSYHLRSHLEKFDTLYARTTAIKAHTDPSCLWMTFWI